MWLLSLNLLKMCLSPGNEFTFTTCCKLKLTGNTAGSETEKQTTHTSHSMWYKVEFFALVFIAGQGYLCFTAVFPKYSMNKTVEESTNENATVSEKTMTNQNRYVRNEDWQQFFLFNGVREVFVEVIATINSLPWECGTYWACAESKWQRVLRKYDPPKKW